MPMQIKVESNINVPKNLAKVRDEAFWLFGASTYHRLMSPYVPFETGTLDETVKIKGGEMKGEVEYFAPHAHYIYEGKLMVDPETGSSYAKKDSKKVYTGKSLNISKKKHSLASARWDKAAEPTQKGKLIASMQSYADSGRLHLSD